MGYPTVDRTAMVEMWRLDVEGAPDRAVVPATLEVRGDAVLVRCEETGTSPTGSALARSWFLVWHGAQGRWIQREAFEVDDHAAARARLDELGCETRAPIADNDVVRLVERRRWRMEHEDRSSRATVFGEGVSEDVVSFDRRAGVSMPTVTGRAAYVAYGLASYELFATMVVDPVAVRGNRLALSRARFQIARGDEMAGLVLYETDEAGLLRKTVVFDESDLVAALDELEARHEAIAGRAYRPADRWVAKFTSACNHRDWDAFAAAFSNDFRVEDHRRLGFPQRDGAALLAATRVRVEQAPDVVVVVAQACSLDDVFMLAHRWEGSTPEGSRYEWHYRGVGRLSPEGLLTQMELFGEDQWAEALALFDEWSDRRRPPSTAPAVANTATRTFDRVLAKCRVDDDRLEDETTDDIVRMSRRRIVSSPETRGRAAYYRNVRSISADYNIEQMPLAVRGDRLAVIRLECTTPDGYQSVFVGLTETDATGRICYQVSWDEEDLPLVLDELENRYCAELVAGSSDHDAFLVRRIGDQARDDEPDAARARSRNRGVEPS